MQVSYHHVDKSNSLNDFVEEKMQRFSQNKEKFSNINWDISKEGGLYKAAVRFKASGKIFKMEGKAGNAYASVLKVLRKMKSALPRKIKSEQRLHRKHVGLH
ncbi:HPF/RaiA family ribosome-associated protein [Halobacteriovorax sp.]|uniref:HPF/RaiA family ribosome-associated protein n=1 Tax=Halobacteriovorax sp. TaxID=2020862 RepID=UPI00356B5C52